MKKSSIWLDNIKYKESEKLSNDNSFLLFENLIVNEYFTLLVLLSKSCNVNDNILSNSTKPLDEKSGFVLENLTLFIFITLYVIFSHTFDSLNCVKKRRSFWADKLVLWTFPVRQICISCFNQSFQHGFVQLTFKFV